MPDMHLKPKELSGGDMPHVSHVVRDRAMCCQVTACLLIFLLTSRLSLAQQQLRLVSLGVGCCFGRWRSCMPLHEPSCSSKLQQSSIPPAARCIRFEGTPPPARAIRAHTHLQTTHPYLDGCCLC